jgi:hypothetical protein
MPEHDVSYPLDPPIDCVREILRIVRSGASISQRAALAKHAWVLQGYLFRVVLGDPDEPRLSFAGANGDEAMCQLLEESFLETPIGSPETTTLGPAAILLLRWLLSKLLDEFLDRR